MKYTTALPTLVEMYVPQLHTTKLLADCVHYLREHGGFSRVGLFRIPGDENLLNLVKVRMQKKFSSYSSQTPEDVASNANTSSSTSSNANPVVFDKLIIGSSQADGSSGSGSGSDEDDLIGSDNANDLSLYPEEAKSSKSAPTPRRKVSSASIVFDDDFLLNKRANAHHQNKFMSYPPPMTSMSANSLATIVVTDLDTVAQILKFSLRDLPEPIITFAAFDQLLEKTKLFKSVRGFPSNDDFCSFRSDVCMCVCVGICRVWT